MRLLLLFFLFTLVGSNSEVFAQKIGFGINAGVNFNNFQIEKDFSLGGGGIDALTSESNTGFHFGIHSLVNVANRVKLSPQLLLAFSKNDLEFNSGSNETNTITIENVFIRVPIDLHLELLKGQTSLYLIGGVEYAANIADDEVKGNTIDLKDDFWSARVGFGFRKDLAKFSVSPELTFTKSFSSIESENTLELNQVITNIDNSIVGLTLKFQGLID